MHTTLGALGIDIRKDYWICALDSEAFVFRVLSSIQSMLGYDTAKKTL